jgi:pimeloyl-ACP methyl ester carboxylesterase
MSFNLASIEGLAVLLLVGLLIALVAATWYTVHMLTHPPRRTYASALARNRAGDPGELDAGPRGKHRWSAWNLRWRNLDLPVWDIEGDKPDGPVIILSHGWGDSRIGGLTRTPALAAFASRLILWDMPGHGEAPGTCSLGNYEVESLLALVDRVGSPAILYGWSLGAGVSIAAAARLDPARVSAVIAEAPYRLPQTPARNVLRSFGLPWRINLPLALTILGVRFGIGPKWRGFDRAELAAGLRVPLLVIHGAQDDICPVQDGRDIAQAAKGPHEMIELDDAGHHSLWTDAKSSEGCAAAVDRFLSALCNNPRSASVEEQSR